MNLKNPFQKKPKPPYQRLMTPGRKRMLHRDALKAEQVQMLYRKTPKLAEAVEDQIWGTTDYPDSRQVSRRTALLEAKIEAGRTKKQPRANPRGNRAVRRAAIAKMSKLPPEELAEIMNLIAEAEGVSADSVTPTVDSTPEIV